MLAIDKAAVTLGERSFEFSLSVAEGEIIAIVGKSGAGKSTLLNMISGFTRLTSGDISWKGDSLIGLTPDARPVTSLFQSHNLFQHLSVEKNIALGLDTGLKLSETQWSQVHASLESVGLAGFGTRMPGNLSGGEQQRVALARCLVRNQPILLLDEPYSALDQSTREEMLELTLNIGKAQNLCTLVVSHNLNDAEALGATVVKITDGRLG